MRPKEWVIINWPILVILFLAVVLRIWRLDELMTIGGDLGYDLLKIKAILDGDLTLLGSPIGRFKDTTLYLGSFYYYLQIPFLLLFKFDPIGAMIPIILGILVTTFLVYLTAQKLFNTQVAVVAAILSALSPYFLEKLGPPSQPYLIPAVTALIFYLVVQKKTLLTTFILGLLSGLMVHLHYLGLSVFLSLIAYIIYTQQNQKLKNLAFLFSGLFLTISPLLLFEVKNKFFLTNQFTSQLLAGAIASQGPLFTNQIVSAVNFLTKGITGFNLPFAASLILLITSVAITLKKTNDQKIPIFFLISIVLINLAMVTLYGQPVHPHYLAASYVPLFIFIGVFVSSFAKIHKVVPAVLIVVISIGLIKGNDLKRTSGYTMPEDLTLQQIRQIAKIVADDVKDESFNITSTLDGDSRALPYRYLIDVYGEKPLDIQTYDKGDSLYIVTRDPIRSVRESALFEIASFQPSNVAKSWNIVGDIKLIKLTKHEITEAPNPKFITIISPIRPRYLWNEQSINVISGQLKQITDRNLKATWLISYDNLFDLEIIELFKNQKDQEIGAFLEVDEKWATDSRVIYKIAQGDYYRPDKVFLSGYSPSDRQKLIKTYFKKFEEVFGFTPQSVGAWYIDSNSQQLLAEMGVTSALTVSDQFDTDAASIWGRYWSMPFYPSKYNSLEPARSQSEKLPIVNLQWAQRDLVAGYGSGVEDSRQSFQANDYINNGYSTDYFVSLLENYLENSQNNDYMQITIGLEAGQEAQRFKDEFEKQIDIIADSRNSQRVNILTAQQFANWYQEKYPGISPSHFLKKGDSFWYMSPKFRVAVFKEDTYRIVDLRYYDANIFDDFFLRDSEPYLRRNVPETIDLVKLGNQIELGSFSNLQILENFDRLTLRADNREVQINTLGVMDSGIYTLNHQAQNFGKGFQKKTFFLSAFETVSNVLSIFRYSNINGQKVFGISLDGTTIIGLKELVPGIYRYDFQVLARFLSPANIVKDIKP